jgi:hypothetical protein
MEFLIIFFGDFYVSIVLPWMSGGCGMCYLFIVETGKHNKVDINPSNI